MCALASKRRYRSKVEGRQITLTEAPEGGAQVVDLMNLGRLLHESGEVANAERIYREAVKVCGLDPVLLYNLGVLLHDTGRKSEAMEPYERALKRDPGLADCHYNLALLCEELSKPKEAIRHMSEYRRLVNRTK